MATWRATLGAIAIAGAIAVGGCGGDDETATSRTDPDGPLVVYERSGGIAGVAEHLEVGRDGTVEVTAGAVEPQHADFDLSDEELGQLSSELEAADFGAVSTTGAGSCADCFIESVATGGRTTTIVAEIDQPPESVSAALSHLRDLVARAAQS
jgi:hypothetical protein